MAADGFTPDDKRLPMKENDIPGVLQPWRAFKSGQELPESDTKRATVRRVELAEQDYDLSFSRYFEEEYLEPNHEEPLAILSRVESLESEISAMTSDLRDLISWTP